jgi:hypothetical protein
VPYLEIDFNEALVGMILHVSNERAYPGWVSIHTLNPYIHKYKNKQGPLCNYMRTNNMVFSIGEFLHIFNPKF